MTTTEYRLAQNRYHQLKWRLAQALKNGGTASQINHLNEKLQVAKLEYFSMRSKRVWSEMD